MLYQISWNAKSVVNLLAVAVLAGAQRQEPTATETPLTTIDGVIVATVAMNVDTEGKR